MSEEIGFTTSYESTRRPTSVSNVINSETLRSVQKTVLDDLYNILVMSFGPNGSNTCIKKLNALNQYTKDGHTILGTVAFQGPIEDSIKEDIEAITRRITVTVGDGTTSAVILSKLIFDKFIGNKELANVLPYELIHHFKKVTERIVELIREHGHTADVDDIYKIAMISTNGNEEISKILQDIYKEYGMGVFIDVAPSTGVSNILKSYDGMTLNTGFADSCYINNATDNTSTIDHPRIYFFEDPIDTPEMAVFLNSILDANIVIPYSQKNYGDVVPTVIIAPKITRDLSSMMDSIGSLMTSMKVSNRIPLLMITDFHQADEYVDICKLCGGRTIRKYIDPKLQQQDVENGNAPTPDTICDWYGMCDRIVADASKTKFINPIDMKNEDGTYTDVFTGLLDFLEAELKKATDDGENVRALGTIKRRIHSLKSNMVEFMVGGVTMADRDSLRDLVEDAVLNCRSAALNGVGYGANFEGVLASNKLMNEMISTMHIDVAEECLDALIATFLANSYHELLHCLYKVSMPSVDTSYSVNQSIEKGMPYNLRTRNPDGSDVLSSIESDIVILETISKIMTLMMTCNQFIVPNPMYNTYTE